MLKALTATPLLTGTVRAVHGPEMPRLPAVVTARWGYADFDFGDEPF